MYIHYISWVISARIRENVNFPVLYKYSDALISDVEKLPTETYWSENSAGRVI